MAHPPGQSAARVLQAVMKQAGFLIEKKKHKPHAAANQGLGAIADLSKVASEGTAEVRPVEKKVKEFIETLEKLQAAGRCTQEEAMRVKGKGRWLTSQLKARAGTAALQPFAQREQEPEERAWTPEMSVSLEFIKVVFSEEFMVPITVDVTPEAASKVRPVLAFSDAAYHEEVDEVCAINADVFDLETMRHSRTHGVIPAEYYQHFMELLTYIGRGELGMGVAMLLGCSSRGSQAAWVAGGSCACGSSNQLSGLRFPGLRASHTHGGRGRKLAVRVRWRGKQASSAKFKRRGLRLAWWSRCLREACSHAGFYAT